SRAAAWGNDGAVAEIRGPGAAGPADAREAPAEAAGASDDPSVEAIRFFSVPGFGWVVYRRRRDNIDQKAGNVADFCVRWGEDYDYMVVLDADSLMTGSALTTLVRLMDENPEAGLIQTVPIPARQETLFGRLVQFAQALHAPLFAAGQSFWQVESANYWGHNAILRVAPFMEHCSLPVLPGSPPLGGRILSHDFVEAALLRRRGWKVYLHPWIEGSWEGVPGTVPAYATRDRRWAQGSLQHLRLLGEKGLHPLSRVHFAFGAMGYVSSFLWLLLLLASTAYVILPATGAGALAISGWEATISLLLVTALLLLLPKFFALGLALRDRSEDFGGPGRLVAGFILETLHSVVVAPVMMMYHTRFVSSILGGRNVPWVAQDRDGRDLSWRGAWSSTGWMTVLGVGWAGVTLYHSFLFFLWLTPIFAGLVLAVPLIRFTSRGRWGRWAREQGLFLVPSETRPHNVLQACVRAPDARERRMEDGPHPVRGEPPMTTPAGLERVERALFELQRGRPLLVADSEGSEDWLLAAVEPMGPGALSFLKEHGSPESLRLVVTHHRARAMGLAPSANGGSLDRSGAPSASNGASALRNGGPTPTGGGWSLGLRGNGATPGPERILHLSSALDPGLAPPHDVRPASGPEAAGLDLLRLGRMLPALVGATVPDREPGTLRRMVDDGRLLCVTPSEIRSLTETSRLAVVPVSDSRVPLESTESARFLLFRERPGLQEHVAVVIGAPDEWPDPLPVRLHSACLTGDLFGSLRCDCGEQLRRSLELFSRRRGGVLLYLSQEGRSIGLANKLRAYALQQHGLDTVDANRTLGFDDDERRYEVAVAMLTHLGIDRVELLTNNPEKVRALESGGIAVVDRIPLHGTLNEHNLPYVSAKVHRAGHWLDEMLGSRLADRPDGVRRADRRNRPYAPQEVDAGDTPRGRDG
ncbi:MAG: glucans biosynthesis glucosyltransferase MdoH, partial [bacterium]